jgi:hypothetical protein
MKRESRRVVTEAVDSLVPTSGPATVRLSLDSADEYMRTQFPGYAKSVQEIAAGQM